MSLLPTRCDGSGSWQARCESMGVSSALELLRRVRKLQEQQEQLALELAVKKQRDLEAARDAAGERERRGRALVGQSVRSDSVEDRQAAVVQAASAGRQARFLAPRVANAEEETARVRQNLLEKRVQGRQTEILIEETAAEEATEADRRNQQALDDWYGSERFAKKTGRR